MTIPQKTFDSHIGVVIDYTPPRLYEGKDWYIGFYAFDPARNIKRRKKIRLNFVDKIGDRRRYASALIKKLHKKLEDGWNPWIESENEKAYHTFTDVCQHYRKCKLHCKCRSRHNLQSTNLVDGIGS